MTRRPRLLAGAFASLAVLASVGVAAGAHAVAADGFTVTVDGALGTVVDDGSQLHVRGDTPATFDAPDRDGGTMTVVDGPDATLAQAVQFPSFVDADTYPRAVLSVAPTSGDGLSPESSDFEYGAVFRVDSTSDGSAVDNGDNIFQRGRYGEAAMFKLQVDHGHPSCLVKGDQGQVLVTSPTKVDSGTWYSATCSRVGTRITVRVTAYAGGADPVVTSADGESGQLAFDADRMASVGGKLNRSGEVARSTDQFNGAIAKVWARRS